MENVTEWLDKKGYYNSRLRTDKNNRIDLYLSDVLDEYRTEQLGAAAVKQDKQLTAFKKFLLRAFKKFLQFEYHLPVSNKMVDEFESLINGRK